MGSNKYKEIFVLKKKLERARIPFKMAPLLGGYQIGYPSLSDKVVCSVIEHNSSYGHEDDRLEIIGLTEKREGRIVGNLTADDVFSRIHAHWKERGKK